MDIRPALLRITLIFTAVAAVAMTISTQPSCATAKGGAAAVVNQCKDQVTPAVVDIVRDASLSTVETDVEALLNAFVTCAGRAAAQAAIAELGNVDVSKLSPVGVTPTMAKERLTKWLAAHPGPAAALRRDPDWCMARLELRTWKLLNGVPSPFIPARANC